LEDTKIPYIPGPKNYEEKITDGFFLTVLESFFLILGRIFWHKVYDYTMEYVHILFKKSDEKYNRYSKRTRAGIILMAKVL